jgi:hypothetical protein
MKKYMVADLVKDLREYQINQIVNEGNVSPDVAISFLNAGNTWPLDDDNSFQWWVENVREDIETDHFDFEIKPSHSTWRNNMHDSPAKVDANLIYESIGPTGSDPAIFSVDVDWPDKSTDAPRTKTYEMDYDKIQEWSNNTSGTYFNDNIRES